MKLAVTEYAALTKVDAAQLVIFIKRGYLLGELGADGQWIVEPNPVKLFMARVMHFPYYAIAQRFIKRAWQYKKLSATVLALLLAYWLNPESWEHYVKTKAVVDTAVAIENAVSRDAQKNAFYNLLRDEMTEKAVTETFNQNVEYHNYLLASAYTYDGKLISLGALKYVYVLPQFNVKLVQQKIKEGKTDLRNGFESLMK